MSARDVLTVFGVMVFALAVGLFLIKFVSDDLVDNMLANEQINQTEGTVDALTAVKTDVTSKFDWVFFSLFAGLILVMLILSWIFAGNPIFMILWVIVLLLSMLLSPILSNVWSTLIEHAQFGTLSLSFPITNHVMTYLPLYLAVVGIAGLVLMFSRRGGGGGEGR